MKSRGNKEYALLIQGRRIVNPAIITAYPCLVSMFRKPLTIALKDILLTVLVRNFRCSVSIRLNLSLEPGACYRTDNFSNEVFSLTVLTDI